MSRSNFFNTHLFLFVIFLQACADGADKATTVAEKPTRSAIYPLATFNNADIMMQFTCTANSDCKIYYTINDNDVSVENATLYPANPRRLTANQYKNRLTKIRYFAVDANGVKEDVQLQNYIIDLDKPSGVTLIDANRSDGTVLADGPYSQAQKVSILCTPESSTIVGVDLGCTTIRYAFVLQGSTLDIAPENFKFSPIHNFVSIQESGTLYYYGEDAAGNASTETPLQHEFIFNNNVNNVSNLDAAFSQSQISLSWEEPLSSTALGYMIRRSDVTIISPDEGSLVYDGQGNSFTDTNVVTDTVYHYRIFAYTVSGSSNTNFSTGTSIRVATVPDVEPGPVTDVNVFPGDKEISFTWTNPSDLDFKEIQILRTSDLETTASKFFVTNHNKSFTDSGLVNERIYHYSFSAVDNSGLTSSAVTLSAKPIATLIAPGNASEFSVDALDSRLKLNWNNPYDPDLAGVRIIQSTVGAPDDEIVSATEATQGDLIVFEGLGDEVSGTQDARRRSTIISGLTNGTSYYYRVFAFNKDNLFSDVATAPAVSSVPLEDSLLPAVVETLPNNVSNVDPGLRTLRISFNKPVLATSLNLPGAIELFEDISKKQIAGTATIEPSDPKMDLFSISDPQLSLATSYTAKVSGLITDLNERPIDAHTWSFQTADGIWSRVTQTAGNVIGAGANGGARAIIGFDDVGNALMVWSQFLPVGGINNTDAIYTNRFDVNTGWDSTKAKSITPSGLDAISPDLAVMENGNAVAVWVQGRGVENVWAAKYLTSSGWQSPVEIQQLRVKAYQPKVEIDKLGTVTIVWLEDNNAVTNVMARRIPFDNDWTNLVAQPIDTQAKLVETSDFDAASVRLSVDDAGNAIVMWNQNDAANTGGTLMYNYFNNSLVAGEGWAAIELGPINSDTSSGISRPELKMAGDGSAVAVWEQHGKVYGNNLVKTDTVVNWQSDQVLSTTTTTGIYSRNIGLDITLGGTALALWAQYSTVCNCNRSFVARFDPAISWSADVEISAEISVDYQVIFDDNQNALLAWYPTNGTTIKGVSSIRYFAGMDLSRLFAQPTFSLESEANRSYYYYPKLALAVDKNGRGMAAFANSAGTAYNDMRAIRFAYPVETPNLTVHISDSSLVKDSLGNIEVLLNYTVTNSGTTQSGPYNVDLWSSLATPPVVGTLGEQTINHVGLAGNSTESGAVLLATGSNIPVGTAYAIVDSKNAAVEALETDNVSSPSTWEYIAPITLELTFDQNTQVPEEVNNVPPTSAWTVANLFNNPPPLTSAGNQLFSGSGLTFNNRACFSVGPIMSSGLSFDFLISASTADQIEFFVDRGLGFVAPNLVSKGLNAANTWDRGNVWPSSPIPPEMHTFEWCYYKGGTQSTASNAVWMDNIVIRGE